METKKSLRQFSDKELQAELTKRGYCATSLWHINDVKQVFDDILEDENYPSVKRPGNKACHTILNNLVGIHADMQPLNDDLKNMIKEKYFPHLSIGNN